MILIEADERSGSNCQDVRAYVSGEMISLFIEIEDTDIDLVLARSKKAAALAILKWTH